MIIKTIRYIYARLAACMIVGFVACSSSNVSIKKERVLLVKEKIENKRYTIDVTQMLPMSGQSRQLTSDYSLTIRNDTVVSHLPYFGRAYSVPYGGGKGLIFDALITDYKMTFDNKGTANITFQTRSEDDVYRFNMQIFNNGSSAILITPNNRQSINFYGNLDVTNEP